MYAWVLVITCCSCKCPNKWTLPHTFPNTKTQVRAHSYLKRSQGLHRHHVLTPAAKSTPNISVKIHKRKHHLAKCCSVDFAHVWKQLMWRNLLLGIFFFLFFYFPHPIAYIYLVSIFIEEKGEQLIWSLQFLVATEQRVYDLYTSCFMSFM